MSELDTSFVAVRTEIVVPNYSKPIPNAKPSYAYPYTVSKSVPGPTVIRQDPIVDPDPVFPVVDPDPDPVRGNDHEFSDRARPIGHVGVESHEPAKAIDVVPEPIDPMHNTNADASPGIAGTTGAHDPIPEVSAVLVPISGDPDSTHIRSGTSTSIFTRPLGSAKMQFHAIRQHPIVTPGTQTNTITRKIAGINLQFHPDNHIHPVDNALAQYTFLSPIKTRAIYK